jgi:hypothetical protein
MTNRLELFLSYATRRPGLEQGPGATLWLWRPDDERYAPQRWHYGYVHQMWPAIHAEATKEVLFGDVQPGWSLRAEGRSQTPVG